MIGEIGLVNITNLDLYIPSTNSDLIIRSYSYFLA